jgi:nitrate/nitrite transporter NarK
LPDAVGAVLLTLSVAALSLAIVEGPDWGWSSVRVLSAFGVSALLLPLFILRSTRHRAPVIPLSLFRVRSFTVANAGVFVFSLGFYALLLCSVLFLTGVWDYSILRAGIALTPGPLMAAIAAVVGGRLSDRFGQRVVAIPGGLLFALGASLFALNVGLAPRYASDFLPATILTGAGIGLSFAAFGSAAVAELPRNRYATGSVVSAAFRQIGAVLGISALIAVIGTPGQADARNVYERAWVFMVVTGAAAGIIAIALGRVRARHVDELGDGEVKQSEVSLDELPLAAPVGGTTG